MKSDSGFIEHNGARLYYEVAGDGPPVTLIHAGVADSRQWDAEFADLAIDHRVVRYDLRGYGRSVPVAGEFSNLDDLEALLDQLELTRPMVLVGNSMGGALAMDFALKHPEQVRGLVMVGAGPSGLDLDVPEHPAMEGARQAWQAGDVPLVNELEAQIWVDGMGRNPDEVDQSARQLMLTMNMQALEHELLELGDRLPDLEPKAAGRMAEIMNPVLIILGEHDVPYMHEAVRVMMEQLPSTEFVQIEAAAHLPNLERPQVFLAAVRGFLERVEAEA